MFALCTSLVPVGVGSGIVGSGLTGCGVVPASLPPQAGRASRAQSSPRAKRSQDLRDMGRPPLENVGYEIA